MADPPAMYDSGDSADNILESQGAAQPKEQAVANRDLVVLEIISPHINQETTDARKKWETRNITKIANWIASDPTLEDELIAMWSSICRVQWGKQLWKRRITASNCPTKLLAKHISDLGRELKPQLAVFLAAIAEGTVKELTALTGPIARSQWKPLSQLDHPYPRASQYRRRLNDVMNQAYFNNPDSAYLRNWGWPVAASDSYDFGLETILVPVDNSQSSQPGSASQLQTSDKGKHRAYSVDAANPPARKKIRAAQRHEDHPECDDGEYRIDAHEQQAPVLQQQMSRHMDDGNQGGNSSHTVLPTFRHTSGALAHFAARPHVNALASSSGTTPHLDAQPKHSIPVDNSIADSLSKDLAGNAPNDNRSGCPPSQTSMPQHGSNEEAVPYERQPGFCNYSKRSGKLDDGARLPGDIWDPTENVNDPTAETQGENEALNTHRQQVDKRICGLETALKERMAECDRKIDVTIQQMQKEHQDALQKMQREHRTAMERVQQQHMVLTRKMEVLEANIQLQDQQLRAAAFTMYSLGDSFLHGHENFASTAPPHNDN